LLELQAAGADTSEQHLVIQFCVTYRICRGLQFAALLAEEGHFMSGHRVLTDLVSLVTYAIGSDAELQSYPEKVREQFQVWLSEQEQLGAKFSDEQLQWLNQIAEAYCDESGNYARRFRLRAVQ
jgi:EcoEI R protein C-terminal